MAWFDSTPARPAGRGEEEISELLSQIPTRPRLLRGGRGGHGPTAWFASTLARPAGRQREGKWCVSCFSRSRRVDFYHTRPGVNGNPAVAAKGIWPAAAIGGRPVTPTGAMTENEPPLTSSPVPYTQLLL